MRRGTTPTLSIKVPGYDLSDFECIYVTIKQGETEITKDTSEFDIENNTIYFSLSQEDTIKLSGGNAYIQLRAVTSAGLAVASKIIRIPVDAILKEGVI